MTIIIQKIIKSSLLIFFFKGVWRAQYKYILLPWISSCFDSKQCRQIASSLALCSAEIEIKPAIKPRGVWRRQRIAKSLRWPHKGC